MDSSVRAESRSHFVSGILIGALITVALLLSTGVAHPAQQSLGLIATAQPIPLTCNDNGCVAELSSFCLQEEREAPSHYTPYHVVGGDGLWLHLTDVDGGRRTVPAKGVARLVSTRGFTAIEVNVSTAEMASLSAVKVSVEVGNLVTLFPASLPDDPNPITAAEAEHVKGSARKLAASIFEAPDRLGDNINILDRAINSKTSLSHLSDQGRREFWKQLAGVPLDLAVDRSTRRAAEVFTGCLDGFWRKREFGFRVCLESGRYEMLTNATFQLWSAQTAGSYLPEQAVDKSKPTTVDKSTPSNFLGL
jgi:hypothetical protein